MRDHRKPIEADGENALDFDENDLFDEYKDIWGEKEKNEKSKKGYLVFFLYIPVKRRKVD